MFSTHEKFGKTGIVTAFSLKDIAELITDKPLEGIEAPIPDSLKVSVIA